jgi:hypothetical protein
VQNCKWVFNILVYFIIVLTFIIAGIFGTASKDRETARALQLELQKQNLNTEVFISQLKQCQGIEDIDRVLAAYKVQRVVKE